MSRAPPPPHRRYPGLDWVPRASPRRTHTQRLSTHSSQLRRDSYSQVTESLTISILQRETNEGNKKFIRNNIKQKKKHQPDFAKSTRGVRMSPRRRDVPRRARVSVVVAPVSRTPSPAHSSPAPLRHHALSTLAITSLPAEK